MEFRFNLNELFKQPVVEIGSSLVPPGFTGDKRALWDTQTKITQIVNAMGEASAQAQGLSKPITTADRLRNSEHKLYLLVDQTANNGKGAVTGMLKTGEKGLYVFDREGQHYQVSPPCVLDFYIHESRQRSGFGRRLFEHMLQKEQIEPVRMAIDRPSDKFLGFLNKHYGLNNPVKQMNNYVVYDGFFPKSSEESRTVEADKSQTPSKRQSANGLQQGFPTSPYGRYGAPRPPCSMGQIIHNDSPVIQRNREPTGVRSEPVTNAQGQGNQYYSNQPAWQTTQSVPNMHYAYSQNQPSYPQHQVYSNHNELYFQNQPNVSNYQSSGGNLQNVASQVIHNQGSVPAIQNPQRFETNNQNNMYQSYTMGQGDATSQGALQSPQSHQIQNMQQQHNAPQFMNNQFQNHIPQNQQYQYLVNQQQPNLMNAGSQQYQHESVRQPDREPLIPQHFDGTLRQAPHMAQSVPAHTDQQASAVPLQNSVSAPVNYQQVGSNYQQNNVQAQAQNVGNTIQTMNISEQIQQQTYQNPSATTQNDSQNPSLPHVNYQQPVIQNHQPVAPQAVYNVNATPQMNVQTVSSPQIALDNQVVINQGSQPQQNFGAQLPNQTEVLTQSQNIPVNVPSNFHNQMHSPLHIGGQNVSGNQSTTLLQTSGQNVSGNQSIANPNAVAQHQYAPLHSDGSASGNQMGALAEQQLHSVPQATNLPGMAVEQRQIQQQIPSAPQGTVSVAHTPNLGTNLQYNQYPLGNQMPNSQQQQGADHQQPPSQQMVNGPNQVVYTNQSEMNRTAQNVTVGSHSESNPNVNNMIEQETRQVRQTEVDLSKGYPPQHYQRPVVARPPIIIRNYDSSAQNSAPKADRPNSLNIEPAEEVEHKTSGDVDAETTKEEALDGDHKEVDSLDGDALDAIEQEIQKLEIAPKTSTPHSGGSRSPGIEAAGIVTPGRSTPGLTDQGYFDLKFYHNKLW